MGFLGKLSVFTGLPYHSVIPFCTMTALYTDNQAPGLGLSGCQHCFSVCKVWKSQLSPSTDGVHHREIQDGILNLSVMCIFLKRRVYSDSAGAEREWWTERCIRLFFILSHKGCAHLGWMMSPGKQQTGEKAFPWDLLVNRWVYYRATLGTHLAWRFEQCWPPSLLSFALPYM